MKEQHGTDIQPESPMTNPEGVVPSTGHERAFVLDGMAKSFTGFLASRQYPPGEIALAMIKAGVALAVKSLGAAEAQKALREVADGLGTIGTVTDEVRN